MLPAGLAALSVRSPALDSECCNSISYGLASDNPFHSPSVFQEADYLSQGEFPTIGALGQTWDSLPGKAGGLPLFSYRPTDFISP
jgi:hypothetical protein